MARPRSEDSYRLLFEGHPHSMWVVDRTTWRFLTVNEAAIRHYGYSREEFLRMTVLDIRPPEEIPAVLRILEEVQKKGVPEGVTTAGVWKHRKKDGTVIDVEIRRSPLRFQGRPALLVSAEDVTERKRAAEALRDAHADLERRVQARTAELSRSEAQSRALLEAIPDLIFRFDRQGTFLDFRPAKEISLALPPDRFLGRTLSEAMPPAFASEVLRRIRTVLKSGGLQSFEYSLPVPLPNGPPREFEARFARSGKDEVVALVRDITERKRAQEEMRDAAESTRRAYEAIKRTQTRLVGAEKMASIGMLMAGIAHEINNPLNVIYGNLRLLKEERVRTSRKVAHMLQDSLAAAEKACHVVEEFRYFARDTGAAEPADLGACVEEAIEQVRPLFGRRIRLTRSLAELPPIRLFRGQFRRVVANLLKNAAEAIDGRGTVTVRLERRRDEAILEVGDTGRGIPRENLERVFEPFFSTKSSGGGFGLGLTLCRAIIENHGGRVAVQSRPGKGSRFTIRLPLGTE